MGEQRSSAKALSESAMGRPVEVARRSGRANGLLAALMLYLFISAITMMGHGLKTAAKDEKASRSIQSVIQFADTPIVALCVGVLITSIVQSSSFTTSLTVGLVVAGSLTVESAVPIVMGANIGTSVTNLLVSVAHIRNRLEFRRALAGAAVHDFFNVLSVAVLFPLEVAFKILSAPATAFGHWLIGLGVFPPNPKDFNLIKLATWPFTKGIDKILLNLLELSKPVAGLLIAAAALVLLFGSLAMLVKVLRGALTHRLGGLFGKVLFVSPGRSFAVGILTTAMVQSSSVTTSLAVPLVATGVLRLRQIYPYTLGANVGTTVTAMLAALALAAGGEGAMGLAVALAHLLFNICGIAIFWPLRRLPLSLAKRYAKVASERKRWVIVFVLGLFFALPVTVIVIASLWK